MKKILVFIGAALILAGVSACNPHTRIIQKTPQSAIIVGIHNTDIEAKMKARARAKEMFGAFTETKPAKCTQEGSVGTTGHGDQRRVSGGTYYQCIIHVKKAN